MTFLDTLHRACRSLGTPMPGLVLAVSGGADSVALVRGLLTLRGKDGPPLVVAHLNHLLRGPESDRDEQFVRDLVRGLSPEHTGLFYATDQRPIADIARAEKANLEAVARRERLRWLQQVARDHALAFIATGHTANDQAETVLHRLLRGTGLDGLRGIAPRRRLAPDVELVRPMLAITRAEVLAFLASLGQGYREDSSNRDPRFTRNRLRHDLLPLLERDYNPRVIEALARLAPQAQEAFAALEERTDRLLAGAELPRAGRRVVLRLDRLRELSPGELRSLFHHLWRRENWPRGPMSHAHFDRLIELLREPGGGDFPGGIHADVAGSVLRVGPR